MKRFFSMSFFCFYCLMLASQSKHANVWVFGFNTAIDFNQKPPKPIKGYFLDIVEGGASFCDKNGNLILYSRPSESLSSWMAIYNSKKKMVINSDTLKTSSSANTHTLMLQHPDDTSIIYIFTAPSAFTSQTRGYNYNVYDIKIDSLIVKNKLLFKNASEKMSAVFHPNGRDIFITLKQHGNNCYNTYLISKHGINPCPIISCVGIAQIEKADGQGFLKYACNGQYIANAFIVDALKIELFKKDPNIHTLIHYRTINLDYSNQPYGLEFSPNGKYLYYTTASSDSSRLVQHNLQTGNEITIYKDFIRKQIFGIQLASDGKIYVSNEIDTVLGVINYPNEEGLACNLNIRGFSLNGSYAMYGMPSFNQSYFYTPAINYSYEMNCIKNSIQFWGKDTFGANNHNWYIRKIFGANNYQLIGNSKDINYTFADTGTYEVRYIASNGNKIDSVVKSIVIYDKIKRGFLGKDTTYVQGDVINKTLFAPTPNHCVRWYDLTPSPSPKERGTGSSLLIDSVGTYICKVTNQAFCEVWDTIVINECINNLTQPSLFRSRDTLRTWHLNAYSFVWYRNNQIYKVTKQPFLALTDTGNYRVEAAKKGHCNSSSIGTNYVQKLNIKGFRIEDLGIRVFPNPSSGLVKIEGEVGFSLEIRDVLGRVIEQLKYEDQNSSPLLGRGVRGEVFLPKGIYFFHFEFGAYKSVEKVVVY
jgi:hypothetical protein